MKSAILLLGFNRIDYFTKVLTSLEKNKAAHEHDLFVYVYNGTKKTKQKVEKQKENSTSGKGDGRKRDFQKINELAWTRKIRGLQSTRFLENKLLVT